MLTVTVSLDGLSKAQKELLAGFILSYPEGYEEEQDLPEDAGALAPAPTPLDDPAAVFGKPEPTVPQAPSGPISSLGPVLVIPTPPPAVPAPPAPLPDTATVVDKKGLPWDARIHSSGRAMNADGTWRGKRGVTAAVLAQVESELKGLMAIPGPLAHPAPTAAQPATTASVATTVASPSAPPPPSAVNEAEMRQKYVEFIGRTSAAISAGKINQEQLKRCYEAVGISDMPQLGIRPDLLPAVAALVDGIIAGQSA